ncbi:unnamed protein product [Rotaria magnacalcarata]|uniref:Uncharacterized protein n=1 Tax=Rotaria magnacalcarata TaxID=392030 RepID=A0A819EC82_9BILA|nr:unnamed protein product [Rotaria magnacalcarata]CAF3989593.1 unnamed protein product [Rotaria magnacalcarata]
MKHKILKEFMGKQQIDIFSPYFLEITKLENLQTYISSSYTNQHSCFVINRGDPYPAEVAATVQAVMQSLNFSNPYRLVWQSKPAPRSDIVKALLLHIFSYPAIEIAQNYFLKLNGASMLNGCNHIETLHELDIEYDGHLAKSFGIEMIRRCASPNDSPIFIKATADIAHKHLQSKHRHTNKLPLRCPGCVNAS